VTLPGRLLEVIESDILPLTREGVARGNKVFGAAVLRRDDLSLVLAETNAETECPLWHGEVHCIKRLYEKGLADPGNQVFLSTHEPCSMCASALAWAGFDTVWFLFSHEDSRDAFAIPHDLRILREVFGGHYHRRNAFWTATPIRDLIAAGPEPERSRLETQVARIRAAYDDLSRAYQAGKAGNAIPLD
jgi:tRNA(Arg) A34 adenosine deaminase TadA